MSASSILSRLRHKGQITEEEYRKLMNIKNSERHTQRVIEDIKAEIQAVMDMYEGCEYIGDKARRDELWHVLEIIDKCTK